eukprot:94789_1
MALSGYAQQNKKDKTGSAEAVRDDMVKVLSATKVSDLALENKAVILDASTTPKQAIEILIKNKVRAAPVLKDDEFLGVLDLRDTLKYVLEAYDKLFALNESGQRNDEADQKSATHAIDLLHSSGMKQQTLGDLCKHRPFRVLNASDSLYELAAMFALGSHVVGVVEDNKLIAVCTQGYFFQQIAKRCKLTHTCCLSKIFELKYITSPIESVNKSTKAVEAFRLMDAHNLSGLAVLNDNGVLIHNTSATDVKLWLLKGEHSLDETIELFLINIRNLSLTERYPITVCQLDDTFKRAMQKLQATKYHRLWIVDGNTKPIGVLALTDIFRFIVASNEKKQEKDDKDDKKGKEKANEEEEQKSK